MPGEVTLLLEQWRHGRAEALDELFPLVYRELRALAGVRMRAERHEHTLEPTALVHEAYLKLTGKDHPRIETRLQFFAVAAQAMRRVLVDHARRQRAAKRPAAKGRADLSQIPEIMASADWNFIDLHDALQRLAAIRQRPAQVVELRYFGGLTNEEAARTLGVSTATVERDWKFARLWLLHALG